MVRSVCDGEMHSVCHLNLQSLKNWLKLYRALSEGQQADGLKVYITGDGADVYEDTFLKLAQAEKGVFHPVLILLGIRLGIDRITPVYWEALKSSLKLPQAVGIAGLVTLQLK